MPRELLCEIPVVDLEDFRKGKGRKYDKFIETVSTGFHDIGFIFVKTPDIAPKLPETYAVFKKLFDLPMDAKLAYERVDIHRQRGYTPPNTEIGIFCQRSGKGGTEQPDAKENWFVGPDLPLNHPLVEKFPTLYAPNIWPNEVPELKIASSILYNDLFSLGKKLLESLEVYLGYSKGFFNDVVKDSPTVLRPLHYPPIKPEDVGNTVWGCQHTDINFLTVLPASTKKGLWVQTRKGEWIPGMAPQGCSLIQVGDMLEYLTGGYFLSAQHKVEAPKQATTEGRYSSALFIHARSDFEFQVDKKLAEYPENYPVIAAAELLHKRLEAIGLAKKQARER